MDDRSINSALFPIRLKEAMDDANENTHSLAERVSLSPSTISRYANGKMLPKITTLYALASFLGVNPIWLMGYDKPKYTVLENVFDHPDIMPIETRKIRLIGDVACGEPIYANEDYESYVEVGTNVKADFAVRANGDSMLPKIHEGDIVFVREQPIVEENEVAVVIIEDEVTLKRYRRIKQDTVMLLPDNPEHNAILVDLNEKPNIRILGKAVALQRDIR